LTEFEKSADNNPAASRRFGAGSVAAPEREGPEAKVVADLRLTSG